MKLSAAHVAENREKVLSAALRLFRERGFGGVSVADLMREAGLTHGGFYNHFDSKSDLEAQVCLRAFAGSAGALHQAVAGPPGPNRKLGLGGYIARYLSKSWRDAPAAHCPMVAFSADVARDSGDVSRAYAAGVEGYVAALAKLADEGGDVGEARRRAIVLTATLTGAMMLARSVRASHPALSDELLGTVRDELLSATMDGLE